jgi:hypothetical protein
MHAILRTWNKHIIISSFPALCTGISNETEGNIDKETRRKLSKYWYILPEYTEFHFRSQKASCLSPGLITLEHNHVRFDMRNCVSLGAVSCNFAHVYWRVTATGCIHHQSINRGLCNVSTLTPASTRLQEHRDPQTHRYICRNARRHIPQDNNVQVVCLEILGSRTNARFETRQSNELHNLHKHMHINCLNITTYV